MQLIKATAPAYDHAIMGATSYIELKINPMLRTSLRKGFEATGFRPMSRPGIMCFTREGSQSSDAIDFPPEVVKAGVVPALDFIDQLQGKYFCFQIINESGLELGIVYTPAEESLSIDLIDADAVVRTDNNRYLNLHRVHEVLGEFIKHVNADVLTIHFDNG